MTSLISNNAGTRLASALSTSATTLSVTPGDGSKFPPLSPGNDWFPLTLVKSDGSLEILHCTARSGDVMTVVRAQEGTAAQAFAAGDIVQLRLTKAALLGLFGGNNVNPTFAGVELFSATPYIDFHHNNSGADYTIRMIESSSGILSILNGQGKIVDFGSTLESSKDIISLSNIIAKGGVIEIGQNSGPNSSIQIYSNGHMAVRPPNGSYDSAGLIWTSKNFSPESRVTADWITTAGFSSNNPDLPYFRRASDNQVYYLQRAIGFSPVQQGGGGGMFDSKVYIGWGGTRLMLQVDATPLGNFVTNGTLGGDVANISINVGSYVFARNMSATLIPYGSLIDGSQLAPANHAAYSGLLSGTFRCMGYGAAGGHTVWQKIV